MDAGDNPKWNGSECQEIAEISETMEKEEDCSGVVQLDRAQAR